MGKKIFKSLKLLCNEILDIIYPPKEKCITCGADGFVGICPCCNCSIKRAKDLDKENFSYGFYGGVLKILILEFKYKKNFVAGDVLSLFILNVIEEEKINCDVICYVPMSRKPQKKRGFNQCKIIANKVSNNTEMILSNCLRKNKNVKEQKILSKDERFKNIEGAFFIKDNKTIKGKNILLIDDVTTTGATIQECKKILKKCGANKIICLTIAKSNI